MKKVELKDNAYSKVEHDRVVGEKIPGEFKNPRAFDLLTLFLVKGPDNELRFERWRQNNDECTPMLFLTLNCLKRPDYQRRTAYTTSCTSFEQYHTLLHCLSDIKIYQEIK